MGCDIHSVIQGQWLEPDNGHTDATCWVTVAEGFHERFYKLFGLLAGVRSNELKPPSEPRGLPHDFKIRDDHTTPIPQSFHFRSIFRHPDSMSPWEFYMGEHSYTWFTAAEIEAAWNSCRDEDVKRKLGEVMDLFRKLDIRHWQPKLKNWRIVIGFDS